MRCFMIILTVPWLILAQPSVEKNAAAKSDPERSSANAQEKLAESPLGLTKSQEKTTPALSESGSKKWRQVATNKEVISGARLFSADVNIRDNGTIISAAPTDLDFIDHFKLNDNTTPDYVEVEIDGDNVFDWTGQHNFDNGLTTFGFDSWLRADSTRTIADLLDSLTENGGVIELGTGVFAIDTLRPAVSFRMIGKVTGRTSDRSVASTGTIIKSTNDSSRPALWLTKPVKGSRLSDLTIMGDTTATNGSGLVMGKETADGTLGDLSASYVTAMFHDSSGFELLETDGNLLWQVNSFFNKDYGIHVRSRNDRGMAPRIDGGRTFGNGKGGIRIDAHTIPTIWRYQTIEDTKVGIYLHGKAENNKLKPVRGPSIMATNIEPDFKDSTGVLIALKLFNVRSGTFANNFIGGGIAEANRPTPGDSLVNEGVRMDSVDAAVFMNNVFAGVDKEIVVDRVASSFLLINNMNANADSIETINGGIDNWGEILINNEETEGRLWIGAKKGLYLSPRAESDIDIFPNSAEDENRFVNIWGNQSDVPVKGIKLRTNTSGDGEIIFANNGIISSASEDIDFFPDAASGFNKFVNIWGDSAEVSSVLGLQLRTNASGHGEIMFANQGLIKNDNSSEDIRIEPASEVLRVVGST